MNDVFLKYMTDRFVKDIKNDVFRSDQQAGPVITISREYGCPSRELLNVLYDKLRQRYPDAVCPWKVVSKEILTEAGQLIGIDPSRLAYVFKDVEKTMMDEVIESMTKRYYVSDKKIKKTITGVIRNIAASGHVILLGRGGVAVTQDILKSVHIRLFASTEWRVKTLMERKGWLEKETRRVVTEMDEKRWKLIHELGVPDADYHIFDVLLNCEKLSLHNMADTIIELAASKGMLAK